MKKSVRQNALQVRRMVEWGPKWTVIWAKWTVTDDSGRSFKHKSTVPGEKSGRSESIKLDGPEVWKWTVQKYESERSKDTAFENVGICLVLRMKKPYWHKFIRIRCVLYATKEVKEWLMWYESYQIIRIKCCYVINNDFNMTSSLRESDSYWWFIVIHTVIIWVTESLIVTNDNVIDHVLVF